MIERVTRTTAAVAVLLAAVTAAWTRGVAVPLGVIGGTLLIGLSFWAIRGSVDTWLRPRFEAETPGKPVSFTLVKFFTRHAIVAVAAYGMMMRLHLDPMGMLLGVSTLGVAVAVEAVRGLRWRRFQ